jgi:hypothetical protein
MLLPTSLGDELDRQAAVLLSASVAALFGGATERIAQQIAALRVQLEDLPPSPGNIPLCIAIRHTAFPADALMHQIVAKGAHGVVDMTPAVPSEFHPLEGLELPASDAYVLLGVDTGHSRLNISPEASLAAIRAEGRTPLTLEEGVMLTRMFPALLTDKQRYNCIQMPGSRRAGDQRVPSIWFSKGAPRLGWCWDRNVHSWLASASAARRLAPS